MLADSGSFEWLENRTYLGFFFFFFFFGFACFFWFARPDNSWPGQNQRGRTTRDRTHQPVQNTVLSLSVQYGTFSRVFLVDLLLCH